ncbi:formate/nitrite transporter family protein [Agromyces sp. MMS24-JH15]|uniref:formate/nitrite transporter family protein n=1 Tax=Agromyces sp. MMS24-JH15 TaxID=3243765 RepID=UPI00374901D6
MRTIEDTLRYQADAAAHKVEATAHPGRYAVQAMLAGAYIGVGVVLMVSAAGPMLAAGDPLAKLVSGLVFGVALTFVVFAGGELATSNMMTLTQGAVMGSITWWRGIGTLAFSFAANLVGALVFAGLVVASRVLHSNPDAGAMLATMLEGKAHETPVELFVRGVLCNLLVCLAIWMCARLTNEVVKVIVIFAAILAFITSGFEHVVANMTTYAIGLFSGVEDATLALFANNLLWVGLGNLVGGAMIVGLGYWVVGGRPKTAAALAVEASGETPGEAFDEAGAAPRVERDLAAFVPATALDETVAPAGAAPTPVGARSAGRDGG